MLQVVLVDHHVADELLSHPHLAIHRVRTVVWVQLVVGLLIVLIVYCVLVGFRVVGLSQDVPAVALGRRKVARHPRAILPRRDCVRLALHLYEQRRLI